MLALRQIPPAVLTTLAAWFGEHATSEQLTAARQRITELEQQLGRLRAEQATQQEAHRRDNERQREEESAQRMRDQKAREAESRQRTEAASRQITELQSAGRKLATQLAERTAELERERGAHEATRQIVEQQSLEGWQLNQAREVIKNARAEAADLRHQVASALTWGEELQRRLAAVEQEAQERQREHKKTLSAAKREAQAARREAQPKRQPRTTARATATSSRRQPTPEPASYYYEPDDQLLMLMTEYVILRDDLARQSISWEGEKKCLPDRTAATIQAHATQLANKKRHEFYNSPDRWTTFPSTWIDYGHRLDEASEAMLGAEVRLKIKKLKKKLGRST